jgi:DNA-binding LacI/PurR family transcriptional regulator
MLSVAYPSPYSWRWQRAIEHLANTREWMFRPVTYTHLDDPVVADTLENFDAAFFGLPSVDPTDHLLRTLARVRRPIVFLDVDLSDQGFPSLWLSEPANVARLMDHLAEQGHRRIACLNTQPHAKVTDIRLNTWRQWTVEHGSAGRLVDEPVASFDSPVERAYLATKQTLADGGFDATALLCCTSAAAKGVYRALHEAGIEVGKDLAVCSADDGAGEAPYFVPSLTALRDPDPIPYLRVCFDWIERGGDWQGPLLVQPNDVPLVIGESTARHL